MSDGMSVFLSGTVSENVMVGSLEAMHSFRKDVYGISTYFASTIGAISSDYRSSGLQMRPATSFSQCSRTCFAVSRRVLGFDQSKVSEIMFLCIFGFQPPQLNRDITTP